MSQEGQELERSPGSLEVRELETLGVLGYKSKLPLSAVEGICRLVFKRRNGKVKIALKYNVTAYNMIVN